MIKAVIFDFDGIIADTENLHFASYQEILEPKGLGFTYEEYSDNYMAFDALGCIRQRLTDEGRHADDATIRAWAHEKNLAYETILATTYVPALPGALDAISQAAVRGPVAICTGAVLMDIAPLLKAYQLETLVSAVVTADDVAISKPDPESYALACKRLAQNPADCLAIEDTPGGLRSARGAGCQTLGVTTTHTEAQLSPYADQVISTLEGWTPPE